MKARLVLLTVALMASAGSLNAQTPNTCPHGTTGIGGIPDRSRATEDACYMALDVFQFMAPQLGVSVTGGNATLGRGGALGGFPHFSVGVRGNVALAEEHAHCG